MTDILKRLEKILEVSARDWKLCRNNRIQIMDVQVTNAREYALYIN